MGGIWSGTPGGMGTAPGPPCGPGRSPRCPPCPGPSYCRLLANKARFHDISWKLSENRGVSPKSVHKACHSPCSQNASVKSPLGFLGFPYSAAFSHKELMGHFGPYLRVYCQNDEVSTMCTPRGRSDTPTVDGSKLPSVDRSSSDLADCRIDLIL